MNSEKLQHIKQYSLSNNDIEKMLYNGKTNIWSYLDLYKFDNILDMMDDYYRMILLLPVSSVYDGHWVCLFYNPPDNTLHYWDSYGLPPEFWKTHWIPPEKVQELGVQENVLQRLLKQASNQGMRITVNKNHYQLYKDIPNTCGRWVSTRLMTRMLSEPQFKALIKSSGMSGDDTVALISYKIIGK